MILRLIALMAGILLCCFPLSPCFGQSPPVNTVPSTEVRIDSFSQLHVSEYFGQQGCFLFLFIMFSIAFLLFLFFKKRANSNKPEASKMTVHWQQGDVMLFVTYVGEAFELLAKQKQIQLEIKCDPQHLLMDFDIEKLQAILDHLLANALKHTPEGGRIELYAYQQQKEHENRLYIKLSDNGSGIPLQHQASIFDHYTQLPNTEEGTRLELAMIGEFTRLLGGDFQLDSAPGRGSTFTLKLPISQQAPLAQRWIQFELESNISEHIRDDEAPILLQKERPTLLLVEDNNEVLEVLKNQLEKDYNILISHQVEEGLETAKKQIPDLIISNAMMPLTDGYDLCRQLKKYSSTQLIPVILLTPKAPFHDKLDGLWAKADAYLCMPPAPDKLERTIRQLLRKQKRYHQQGIPSIPQTSRTVEEEKTAVLFMEKLHNILNNHLQNESFKVADICLLLGTNQVNLDKKVKQYTGQPTATYIRHYRLKVARKLLQQTDLTIAEVAHRVGITNASNFSNRFKKAFGISPGEWQMENLVTDV